MATDGKYTHVSDHFVMYANVQSLCRTSEINATLYVNHSSISKKEKKRKIAKVFEDNFSISPGRYFHI